jgi:hypothetical protein
MARWFRFDDGRSDFPDGEAFSRRSSVRDVEDPGWARGSWGPRPERSPGSRVSLVADRPEGGYVGGSPPYGSLLQRDSLGIAKAFVDSDSEETSVYWKSDDDALTAASQGSVRIRPAVKVSVKSARPSGKTRLASQSLVYPVVSRPHSYAADVSADRRLFNYTGFPKTTSGTYARTEVGPRDRLQFKNPSSVVQCVQRHERRSVLFAKRKVGKGVSVRTRKKRNSTSSIGC